MKKWFGGMIIKILRELKKILPNIYDLLYFFQIKKKKSIIYQIYLCKIGQDWQYGHATPKRVGANRYKIYWNLLVRGCLECLK